MEEAITKQKSHDIPCPKKKKGKCRFYGHYPFIYSTYKEDNQQQFSFDEFEKADYCSFHHFGSTAIIQEGYQCSSCDPEHVFKICEQCYLKCHENCVKKEEDLVQNNETEGEAFVCYCGQTFRHIIEPVSRKITIQQCKMIMLDKRIQNIWRYYCNDHKMAICSICYVECHGKCVNKSKTTSNDQQNGICCCENGNHTEFNEFTFEISASEYKSLSDITNLWPIQIINILFSTKEIYNKLSEFVGKVIREYDGTNCQQIDKSFPIVISLFSSLFNSKFKTYYYEEEILSMFPYEKLVYFMRNLETNNANQMLLKFRMMFILLFVHLRRDFNLIKSYTTSDFLTSSILERLQFRKFIFTSSIYTKEIHSKYFGKDSSIISIALHDVGFFMEKGMSKNISFDQFQGEYEIGLKFLCFILKRMLFSKSDLVKLINSLYQLNVNFFGNVMEKKNFNSVKDIFICLAEIFFLIGINYNDLVINEYLESMPLGEFDANKAKVGEFIHVTCTEGSQLFKMIVKSSEVIAMHYKNEVCFPEKILVLFNEALKLFTLADNTYSKQISQITKHDLKEFYEKNAMIAMNKEHFTSLLSVTTKLSNKNVKDSFWGRSNNMVQVDALYELKCKIEAHLYAFFISSYHENRSIPENILDDIKDFTRKITSKMYTQVFTAPIRRQNKDITIVGTYEKSKMNCFVQKLISANLKYFPFLVKDDFKSSHSRFIEELIFSNIDETISKVLAFFSVRSYANLLSYDLLDIILSFLSLFCLSKRGLKYFLMGKNLTRLNKILNRYSLGKSKNIKSDDGKTKEVNLRNIKRLLDFLLLIVKGINLYNLNLNNHKIILRFKRNLLEHAEQYCLLCTDTELNDYKIQLTLIMKILYLLSPYYEYEDYEQIKSSVIKIFTVPKLNCLNTATFTQNFSSFHLEGKRHNLLPPLKSSTNDKPCASPKEKDDKGRVLSENCKDEVLSNRDFVEMMKIPINEEGNLLNNEDGNEMKKLLSLKENITPVNENNSMDEIHNKHHLVPKGDLVLENEEAEDQVKGIEIQVKKEIAYRQMRSVFRETNYKQPRNINQRLYFAFFRLVCKNTYYTCQDNDIFNQVHQLNDLEVYKNILSQNRVSLRHRTTLLEYLRTIYFLDKVSSVDIDNKTIHFTSDDFLQMMVYIQKSNIQTESIPKLKLLTQNYDVVNEEKYKMLSESKKFIEQMESVVEIYSQEVRNFPNQIEGGELDNVENYIVQIILGVKFIADFFFLETDIWSKIVLGFYKLAKRFILKANLFKKVYNEIKTCAKVPIISKLELIDDENPMARLMEKRNFQIENKNEIYTLLTECFEDLFKSTKLNKGFSIGTYLDEFDNIAESNFTPFALIETKDYEYFYEEEKKEEEQSCTTPCQLKIKKIVKAYTNQFININNTNFFEVIGGMANECDMLDYGKHIIKYFLIYFTFSNKQYLSYTNLVSLLCIVTKMLFYDTEATQKKLEALALTQYTNFFQIYNQQLQETFLHTLITSKNIFLHERFLQLSSLNKLIIQFLQLLAEGFNTAFHPKIFEIAGNEEDNIGGIENANGMKKISVYESIIMSLQKTYDMMDLGKMIDSELPHDKLLVLNTNLIDFLEEYVDVDNTRMNQIIDRSISKLFANGTFQSLTLKFPNDPEIKNKYLTRRKLICYIKSKFVHLLISYFQTGEKKEILRLLIKDYSPSVLFEEILFNFNDLITRLQESGKIKEDIYSYKIDKFVNTMINYYIYEEDFRESLQLSVCFKLFMLIKIIEDIYHYTLLKQHFEAMENFYHSHGSAFEQAVPTATPQRQYKGGESSELYSLKALKINNFLKKIILKVEIKLLSSSDETATRKETFFERPSITFNISKQSMASFIFNVSRDSSYTKITELLCYSDYFIFEMVCNSHLIGKWYISQLISMVEFYYLECINFVFIIVHNILVICHFYHSPNLPDDAYDIETEKNKYQLFPDNFWVGIVQGIYIIIVLGIWMRYKFPLYFQHNLMKTYHKHFIFQHKSDSRKKFVSKSIRNFFSAKSGEVNVLSIINELNCCLSRFQKIRMMIATILLNSEISVLVYNLILLILYFTTASSMWLVIPILFVANLSAILYDIFFAVQLRYKQLTTILLFTYLLIYIFMWITFYFMYNLFEFPDVLQVESKSEIHESFCHSSVQCLLMLIDFGTRSGGGIGDILQKVSYKQNTTFFIQKFFYDMLFHIIIIMVLGNIFLGIIVDTFADLRDQNQKKEDDLNNVCFICQLSRDRSLAKNVDFEHHVAEKHPIWNYVYFLTYLHIGNPNDFSEIENYVWEKLGDQDSTWIPIESTD